MLDPLVVAYLAGCMDSDGYFTIRRDTRSMKIHGRTPTHVAHLGLRQVTPQVPLLLHSVFKGHLGITRATAPNGRPLHGWHVTATQAAVAAEILLPYLRIKGRQAQLLIDLQARKGAIRIPGSPGVQRVTEAELSARDALHETVRRLNRTGLVT